MPDGATARKKPGPTRAGRSRQPAGSGRSTSSARPTYSITGSSGGASTRRPAARLPARRRLEGAREDNRRVPAEIPLLQAAQPLARVLLQLRPLGRLERVHERALVVGELVGQISLVRPAVDQLLFRR